MNLLPKREEIDNKAIEIGRTVTANRRIYAKWLDSLIELFILGLIMLISLVVLITIHRYTGFNILGRSILIYSFVYLLLVACIVDFLYNFFAIAFCQGNTFGKTILKIVYIHICSAQ